MGHCYENIASFLGQSVFLKVHFYWWFRINDIKGWKHLGWKQVIPESNSNPHEKIEALVKVISGAFKRHYNCIFLLSTD